MAAADWGPIANVALKELKPYMIEEHLSRLRKEGGRNGAACVQLPEDRP